MIDKIGTCTTLNMSDLTEAKRNQIIGLFKGGATKAHITKTLGFSKTTVLRTIQLYCEGKTLTTQLRSGRPKLLNNEHQKTLKNIVRKNNRQSAEQIKNKFQEKTEMQVSTRTIRRNLHELNIFFRIPASKPLLSDKQRENRLNWCIEKKDWSVNKWKSVIWSDESRFTIFKNDGPGCVWRTPGTRFNINNMVPSIKHGGGGLMMWGCFSRKGLGPLVRVDGKMKHGDYIQILEKHLLPLINKKFRGQNYLFQDDNAPVHTAKNVKKWFETKKIKILENWPSQSPDLNPIEHLWSELERRIRNRPKPATNIKELEHALHEEWNKIPKDTLMNLINSMPRKIEVYIKNNGWPTKY